MELNTSNLQKRKLSIKSPNKVYDKDSLPYILSEYLLNRMLENKPDRKISSKDFVQIQAKYFDLLLRNDKRNPEEVAEVLSWSQDNQFWSKNILSGNKFRIQYDRLVDSMNLEKNKLKKQNIYTFTLQEKEFAEAIIKNWAVHFGDCSWQTITLQGWEILAIKKAFPIFLKLRDDIVNKKSTFVDEVNFYVEAVHKALPDNPKPGSYMNPSLVCWYVCDYCNDYYYSFKTKLTSKDVFESLIIQCFGQDAIAKTD